MGNRISMETNDAHALLRDKEGTLKVYRYTMEDTLKCQPLPSAFEDGVQLLFLPSSNYKNKNYHTHVFADSDCDTRGNDLVNPETTIRGKNLNHLKNSADSNSGFFQMNEFSINEPPFPKFFNDKDGRGNSRFAGQSAYSLCKPVPFPSTPDITFSYTPNGIPMSLFTDDKCTNEYINHLPIPKEASDFFGPYNVDNKTIESKVYNVPYTDVKTYLEPAPSTAAKYYRIYKQFPEN